MKNIEQLDQVNAGSGNIKAKHTSNTDILNVVVLEKAQLSVEYNNIPLAHALQSGHLLSGVFVKKNDGELNSIINKSEFKLDRKSVV